MLKFRLSQFSPAGASQISPDGTSEFSPARASQLSPAGASPISIQQSLSPVNRLTGTINFIFLGSEGHET